MQPAHGGVPGAVLLSVVMPAHNEHDYLEAAVKAVVTGLRATVDPEAGPGPLAFELLICENGSSDGTSSVATGLEAAYDEVRMLSQPQADYGGALRAGFLAARGALVANFDVDYVDLGFLHDAMALMTGDEETAAVIARKRGPGARDARPIGRRMVTAAFSVVLRYGFGLRVSDTHGMKVLRRGPMAPVVDACRFGADLFDSELILRAERAGLVIAELPATVHDTRPPRTPISQRIRRTLVGLVRLRILLWRERYR